MLRQLLRQEKDEEVRSACADGIRRMLHIPVLRSLKVFLFLESSGPALVSQSQPSRFSREKLKDSRYVQNFHLRLALAGACSSSPPAPTPLTDAVIDYTPGAGFACGLTNPAVVSGARQRPLRIPSALRFATPNPLARRGRVPHRAVRHSIQKYSAHPYGLDFTVYRQRRITITRQLLCGRLSPVMARSSEQHRLDARRVSADTSPTPVEPAVRGPSWTDFTPPPGTGNFNLPVNPPSARRFAARISRIAALYAGSGRRVQLDIPGAGHPRQQCFHQRHTTCALTS